MSRRNPGFDSPAGPRKKVTKMALTEKFIAVLRHPNGALTDENHERLADTYDEALADAERKLQGAAGEGVTGIHATIEKRLYLA